MDPFAGMCQRPPSNMSSYGSRLSSLTGGSFYANREANSLPQHLPMRTKMPYNPHPDDCATSLGVADFQCSPTNVTSSLRDPYLASHRSPFQLPSAKSSLKPTMHAFTPPYQLQHTENVGFRSPQQHPRYRSEDFTWHSVKHSSPAFDITHSALRPSASFSAFNPKPAHLPREIKHASSLCSFDGQTVSRESARLTPLHRGINDGRFSDQPVPIPPPICCSSNTTRVTSPPTIESYPRGDELWRTTSDVRNISPASSQSHTGSASNEFVDHFSTETFPNTESPTCKRLCVSRPSSEPVCGETPSPLSALDDAISDRKTDLTTTSSDIRPSPSHPKPPEVRFGIADFMNPIGFDKHTRTSPLDDSVALTTDIIQADTNDPLVNVSCGTVTR